MRSRALHLPFAVVLLVALLAAACQPGGTGTGASLKIGLVTDVGTIDDKNFNEYSWKGAVDGAKSIGAPEPRNIVTTQSADYEKNIQSFVDQRFNVIITVGFAIGQATSKAAKANKDIKFIGVDQGLCVDEKGDPDPTFGCKGDAATLLPNYQGLVFAEQEPGYLAGIVAASITKNGTIGAIGGSKTIPPVVRYIVGYQAGALSVNPNVKVQVAYVSDDLTKAFNDPAGGKAFAQQFIQQQKPDVLFQVAGKTGNGVLEAACDASIYGIGVDVDQHASLPSAAKCIVTSAEKKLQQSVAAAIKRIGDKQDKGGTVPLNAQSEPSGIGLSPYYEQQSLITPDIQKKVDDAFAKMKSGELKVPTS
jgi:basic membrane protein A and related proteins